ncbi:hypothetical protein OHJ16_08670 [Actinomyces israelii]|uniref:Uncharacterized protein n=1 Tax=Actinomyces israelii TaxID=1659 RepID=A0ABT4I8P8_9ACTO|nr:hypothetical protein [Actinomyces israelii]MCZ0858116.1 hypothetical protein [Actinomyces israelii]
MAVGHQVRTMIVAVAVGLGIALWRVGTVRAGAPFGAARRVTALVPPVLAMAQVSADHAGWNACGSALGWMDNDAEGVPWWVRPLWLVGGRGALAVPVSVALLGCCLLVDDYRRGGARERGPPLPEAPAVRLPVLTGVPGPLQAVSIAVLAPGAVRLERPGGGLVGLREPSPGRAGGDAAGPGDRGPGAGRAGRAGRYHGRRRPGP